MTLTNEKRLIRHEGNGATTNFPYDFLIPDANSVIVSLWDEATDTTTVLNASQYNITGLGDPNFGEVTYPLSGSPIAAGTWLVIEREVAYTQDLLIKNQGGFFADSTMAQLDRIVMQTQQLAETLERTPKFSPGSGVSNIRITQGDEGTALIWNADGNIVEGPSTTEIESAQTYATEAKAARDEAEDAQAAAEDARDQAISAASSVQGEQPSKEYAEANYHPDVAPDFIRTAGYSAAGDGGGALYKKAASEPSHAGKFSITLDDGVTVVWYEIAEEVLTERMFGAPCDSAFGASTATGTDATDIIKKWAASTASMKKRFTGVSRVSEPIEFPAGTLLEGNGHHTGLTALHAEGGFNPAAVIYSEGELVQVADLASSPAKGDKQLVLEDTDGLKAGDYLVIRDPTESSWSEWETHHTKGEWVRLQRVVDSTTVNLFAPLYDSYDHTKVEVHVMRTPQTIFRNFTIETPDKELSPWLLRKQVQPRAININHIGNAAYAGGWFDRAVDFYLEGNHLQLDSPTSGNEYGVSISCSSGGRVVGNYYALRHGIANTFTNDAGCVPNRNITFECNTYNNAGVPSIDVGGHSGIENCTVLGGTHDGLAFGGKNIKVAGATIRKADRFGVVSGAPGMCLQGAEIVGGDFVFDNCTIESLADPSAGSVGVVQVILQDAIKEPIRLFFNNCRWIVHPDTLYVFRLQFQGCEQDVEVYINGGHVEGGDSLTRFIWARYTSGDKSNYKAIHINGLTGLPASALETPVVFANATCDSLILPPVHGSNTWSPGEIADGDSVVRNISVPGCEFGDRVTVGYSASIGGCSLTGYVLSSGTVQAVMSNNTGSAVTPSDGTVYATVERVRTS